MKILVTGANGFVGKPLCSELIRRGHDVRISSRGVCLGEDIETFITGEIDCMTEWGHALRDVDCVIHLAARVHVMKDTSTSPITEFRKVNVEGTENLARSAAAAGVKRLVYVSSIKVNGEETFSGLGFRELDDTTPQDPYGISKWEAEQALHRIAEETGLEVVIVRPPLVYGAGVKGNFVQMLKVVAKRLPLPFASIVNQRSLIFVGNLVDALIVCAAHPAAAGRTYFVSDGDDVSTPDLLRHLGLAMGRPARLFSFPPKLLLWTAASVGKTEQLKRLAGSLQIDSGRIRRELNWTPPYTLQQGLQETAEWYRDKYL